MLPVLFLELIRLVLPLCFSEVLSLSVLRDWGGKRVRALVRVTLVSWTDLPLSEQSACFLHSHPDPFPGRKIPWPLTLPSALVCRDAVLWEAGFSWCVTHVTCEVLVL